MKSPIWALNRPQINSNYRHSITQAQNNNNNHSSNNHSNNLNSNNNYNNIYRLVPYKSFKNVYGKV